MNRREFLSRGTAVVAGAALTGLGTVSCSNPTNSTPQPVTIDITQPTYSGLATVGGAVKITMIGEDLPVIVIRSSQNAFMAFSSKCTHAGCEVGLPVSGVITCPCHGSTYDSTGARTSGPAQSNLNPFTATLQGNQVTISA